MNPTNEVLRQKLEMMRQGVTKGKRETTDILRMIDLAKQSPRAALNQDFIDRVEQIWQIRAKDVATLEQVANELEHALKTGFAPPEPPKPTGPESA